MPGPPPKNPADRRRRNASPDIIALPADGRPGDPPKWPLGTPSADETAVWASVWSMPQAVEWERIGWMRAVARYVRMLVEAEQPGAPATLLAEVRQMEDRLGLTPMSMLRLRWAVTDEPSEPADAAPVTPITRRIVAVDPSTAKEAAK